MQISLDHVLNHYEVTLDQKLRFGVICLPKPYQFLSMVQYLGNDKKLKIDIQDYQDNYRLIPYGNNIYGVYASIGHQLWNSTGSLNEQFEGNREDYQNPVLIVKWNREQYKLAKEKHSQYWTWKNNRNEARSALEEEHGFDTKHASHLVRLLRMGQEALENEEIIVKRPDAQELLDIRNGSMTYDEIIEYAEYMDNQIKDVWYKKTKLPKKPNVKFAAKLLMDVQDLVWNK